MVHTLRCSIPLNTNHHVEIHLIISTSPHLITLVSPHLNTRISPHLITLVSPHLNTRISPHLITLVSPHLSIPVSLHLVNQNAQVCLKLTVQWYGVSYILHILCVCGELELPLCSTRPKKMMKHLM